MTYYRFIHPYLDGIDYYKLMKDLFIVIPYDIFICIMLMQLTYEYTYGYYEYYFPLYSLQAVKFYYRKYDLTNLDYDYQETQNLIQ